MIPAILTHEDAFATTDGTWKVRFYAATEATEKAQDVKTANEKIAKEWAEKAYETELRNLVKGGKVTEEELAKIDKDEGSGDDDAEAMRQLFKGELSNRKKTITKTLTQVAHVLATCHVDKKGREAAVALVAAAVPDAVERSSRYFEAMKTIEGPKQLQDVIQLLGKAQLNEPTYNESATTWAERIKSVPAPPTVKTLNGRAPAKAKPKPKNNPKTDPPATTTAKATGTAQRGK
jgi:hypothetical protein